MPKIKKRKLKLYGSQQIKGTKAWKIFSLWVRKSSDSCYACGRLVDWNKSHASHYIAGSVCGKTLFFSEKNVKKSCTGCNLFLHGNLPQYALHLKREFGDDILEMLDFTRKNEKEQGIICRYSADELEEIYQKYSKLLENMI